MEALLLALLLRISLLLVPSLLLALPPLGLSEVQSLQRLLLSAVSGHTRPTWHTGSRKDITSRPTLVLRPGETVKPYTQARREHAAAQDVSPQLQAAPAAPLRHQRSDRRSSPATGSTGRPAEASASDRRNPSAEGSKSAGSQTPGQER
ncbi:MAG: hypothetical protein MZV63_39290 [Marinilabiliales bacterium]|nr:hypothetical protein [Marinilabiliales bacterium]